MFGIDTNITDMKCNIQMDHVLDISGYDFDQVHIALDIYFLQLTLMHIVQKTRRNTR